MGLLLGRGGSKPDGFRKKVWKSAGSVIVSVKETVDCLLG